MGFGINEPFKSSWHASNSLKKHVNKDCMTDRIYSLDSLFLPDCFSYNSHVTFPWWNNSPSRSLKIVEIHGVDPNIRSTRRRYWSNQCGYDLLADFELKRGCHDASLVVAHLQLMALVGETLLAFKAGRAFRREGTNIVEPSPVKGAIYITNGEDGLLHFIWKDRVTNNIEEVRFSISLYMVVSCIWDSRTLYYFLSTHRSWRWIKWPRVEYMSSSSRLLIKDTSWVPSLNCTTLFINLSSFS